MRVLLADHHPEVCSALRLLMEEKAGVNVIGEVNNSHELLGYLNSLRPDLVLLDWELPGTDPVELIKILHILYPELRVIAMSSAPGLREESLKDGATGFICKAEPPEELMHAIEISTQSDKKGI
jgi:DNA-binding NarL/FixJ family response regulator